MMTATETDPATGIETETEMHIETVIGIGTTDFATTGVETVIVTTEGMTVSVAAPARETAETGPFPPLPPIPQLLHPQKKRRKAQLHP